MKSIKITLIIVIALFNLNSTFAQLKVFSNNNVQIGPLWWSTAPTTQLFLNGSSYFNCYPSTSGLSLVNYNNLYLGNTYNEPILLPQWANSAWLGNPTKQFFRVYTNQIYSNSVLIPSDSNLKTNIVKIKSDISLNKILALNGYTYDYKVNETDSLDDLRNVRFINENRNQIGVLAQELINEIPEAVKLDNETGTFSVNYIMLIPLLIESIKQQQQQINTLKQQVDALKK